MLLSSASKHLGSMNDVPSLDEETFSDSFSYPTRLVWHHGEGAERWWSWNSSKEDRPCVERVILKYSWPKNIKLVKSQRSCLNFCVDLWWGIAGLDKIGNLDKFAKELSQKKEELESESKRVAEDGIAHIRAWWDKHAGWNIPIGTLSKCREEVQNLHPTTGAPHPSWFPSFSSAY